LESQCAGKYWAKPQDAKLKILEFVYFGQKVRLRIGFSRGAQFLGFRAMAKGWVSAEWRRHASDEERRWLVVHSSDRMMNTWLVHVRQWSDGDV
jgi:hypothetical protein